MKDKVDVRDLILLAQGILPILLSMVLLVLRHISLYAQTLVNVGRICVVLSFINAIIFSWIFQKPLQRTWKKLESRYGELACSPFLLLKERNGSERNINEQEISGKVSRQ